MDNPLDLNSSQTEDTALKTRLASCSDGIPDAEIHRADAARADEVGCGQKRRLGSPGNGLKSLQTRGHVHLGTGRGVVDRKIIKHEA